MADLTAALFANGSLPTRRVAAGSLRPVTDGQTQPCLYVHILNEPFADSIAYRKFTTVSC